MKLKETYNFEGISFIKSRQKLAQLLENDNVRYLQEIEASQETPEQIRARMADRVKNLKKEREE